MPIGIVGNTLLNQGKSIAKPNDSYQENDRH